MTRYEVYVRVSRGNMRTWVDTLEEVSKEVLEYIRETHTTRKGLKESWVTRMVDGHRVDWCFATVDYDGNIIPVAKGKEN